MKNLNYNTAPQLQYQHTIYVRFLNDGPDYLEILDFILLTNLYPAREDLQRFQYRLVILKEYKTCFVLRNLRLVLLTQSENAVK